MGSDADRYRRNASFAQREADRAANEIDKAAWLKLAEGWLNLIPKSARSASEAFDAQARDRGAGQDVPKEPQ
jgi:hypothetical protein